MVDRKSPRNGPPSLQERRAPLRGEVVAAAVTGSFIERNPNRMEDLAIWNTRHNASVTLKGRRDEEDDEVLEIPEEVLEAPELVVDEANDQASLSLAEAVLDEGVRALDLPSDDELREIHRARKRTRSGLLPVIALAAACATDPGAPSPVEQTDSERPTSADSGRPAPAEPDAGFMEMNIDAGDMTDAGMVLPPDGGVRADAQTHPDAAAPDARVDAGPGTPPGAPVLDIASPMIIGPNQTEIHVTGHIPNHERATHVFAVKMPNGQPQDLMFDPQTGRFDCMLQEPEGIWRIIAEGPSASLRSSATMLQVMVDATPPNPPMVPEFIPIAEGQTSFTFTATVAPDTAEVEVTRMSDGNRMTRQVVPLGTTEVPLIISVNSGETLAGQYHVRAKDQAGNVSSEEGMEAVLPPSFGQSTVTLDDGTVLSSNELVGNERNTFNIPIQRAPNGSPYTVNLGQHPGTVTIENSGTDRASGQVANGQIRFVILGGGGGDDIDITIEVTTSRGRITHTEQRHVY